MKKKFAAFLREENSLRELAVTDAEKPVVDPAIVRRWQRKVNLLAMEAKESVALLLRVQSASIDIVLKSGHLDQSKIEGFLANGLYLNTDSENQDLLITGSAADGAPAGMASITPCFGLPIHWPDDVLFGAICILHYPGKKLKPVYRNILIELRDTVEDTLADLLAEHLAPAPPQPEAAIPVPEPAAAVETPAPPEPEQTPETPAAAAPEPAEEPAAEQEVAPAVTQSQPQDPDRDALTAIYGRKKIEDILKHEFERAKRYFKTFSITMIDLNDFQNINDSFGRDAGDTVLQTFSQSVGSKIRETDSWGRWSGDAFILVCPYADTVETQQMFTRIKPLVTRDMKEAQGYTDFSLGVSQYEPDDLTYQAIINRAEENMHQYKEMVRRKAFAEADDRNASSR